MTDQQRYPVAERNHRAKMKFLDGMKTYYESKRKVSIESLQTEAASQKCAVPKIDLSIPGTPVCSRYLRRRRESESEVTLPKEPAPLPNEIVISSLVIDKFLKEMKALGTDEPDGKEQQAEVVQLESDSSDSGQEEQGEVAQQYFKESEQKHAYHRSFSEAVQTLHSSEVKSPVVKRYFEESSAKHTYARDFNEAFNELNPSDKQDDPLKDNAAATTKGYKPSVPGTPINSKHLDKFKKQNYISDSSDDEDEDDSAADRDASNLANPLNTFIKKMETLKAATPVDISETKKSRDKQFSVEEYLSASESKKSYARSFSQAAQALYSTEVKDPAIKDYFDQSVAKKTFRREFSEVYQEIQREELPKSEQPQQVIDERMEQKKVYEDAAVKYDSLEELFGTFEPPKLEKKPVQTDFSVNSYMSSSDAKKTYVRSFSEAAQTLHTSDVKNPTVRDYFDQSEAKQSFRREFSEVYQEVDVTEITRDIVPTKPISSDQLKDNKQSENPISRSNANDGLSVEGWQKQQPPRSISVPGTPINSRKLYPKEKPSSSVESKPERDGSGAPNRTGSQSEMTVREHAENAASASVRGRAVSAAENSMENEFWKSFGAS
ncbi:uncharacterized protein LOC135697306 [Ochlerotatus camptorhynchus]|uniref:uncharacterized protein LOC135697306 n=1 Tax=Ochlerotatus camptorhynchus TaxID=644619 RepID=UPI0031DFE7AF